MRLAPVGEWLGIDLTQWRPLVVAYLKSDFRAVGGATVANRSSRAGSLPITGILVITAISGGAFALLAATLDDVLLSATMLTTYGAANAMMLLLVDFTSVVVSPQDYGVLGHRPVGSRTYFAARLASVGVYVSAISLAFAVFPGAAYAFARGLGVQMLPMTILAVALCNLSATVLVIAGYVFLLGYVHPERLRRATSYLQLTASMAFYGVYYLAVTAFRQSFFDRIGFREAPWLWANPAAWFAAYVPIGAGAATPAAWMAAGASVMLIAACVPLAAGRLSLDYAQRLGEIAAVAEPARGGSRRSFVPGFGRDEARAVALLVRAQFRFDSRFRMALLSMLPLTAFYILLGMDEGALADPFSSTNAFGAPVYVAIVFLPMTIHASLSFSESWRAAWIFFATPASHARIVEATKNFVSVYLLGGYLLLLAALWCAFYETVWHAAVHALFVWLIAHLLLQLVVIVKPALPFAAEPRGGERSFALLLTFIVGAAVAGFVPVILPTIYADPALTLIVLVALAAVTAAMEYALRLRVEEAIGDLEFRA